MQFGTKHGSPEKTRTQCVIVGVYETTTLTDNAERSTRRAAAPFVAWSIVASSGQTRPDAS
ncbi:MAG: hypothetical protein U5O39_02110 [Gammaproteobacteria bacterium]|nr:hypothetical protein [Gammaproteobacteria bacterium]